MSGIVFFAPAWLALAPLWPLLLFARRAAAARRARPTPDFELWRRAAELLGKPRARTRLDLRDAALLVAPLLLTLALADPRPVAADDEGDEVVLVLDRSASTATATTPGGPSRLLAGIARAEAAFGGRTRRVGVPPPAAGEDPSSPAPVAASPERLSAVAAALAADGARVVVVTDRADVELPAGVGRVVVASGAPNAGLVACAFGAEGLLVRTAADAGAGLRRLRVLDASGTDLVDAGPSIDPRGYRRVFDVSRAAVARVVLEPGDANPLDDVAVVEPAQAPTRLAVACDDAASVVRALRAQPEVEVVFGRDADAALTVARDAAAAPAGAPLLLLAPFVPGRGYAAGPVGDVDGDGAGVGPWSGFTTGVRRWPEVRAPAATPPDDVVLLAADGRPLISRSGATAVLWCDPDASAWTRSASFPLAVRRLLRDLGRLDATEPRASGPLASDETLAPPASAAAEDVPPTTSSRRAPPRSFVRGLAALAALAWGGVLARALVARRVEGPRGREEAAASAAGERRARGGFGAAPRGAD